MDSAPFCAFCLRANPPNVEFYKHVVGSTIELRHSFQSMLGYDFQLSNFSICKPCWKLMQLVQDFRLRCFKANGLVERVGKGLTSEDDWFSVKNLAMLESVRMVIKDQVQQIGKVCVAGVTNHEPNQDHEGVLVSTVDVGVVKVESDSEIADEVSASNDELHSPQQDMDIEFNGNTLPFSRTSIDVQECTKCNRSFANSRAVKLHSLRCEGQSVSDRFVTCLICSATFTHNDQLQVHANVHLGKTPYKCSCCQRAFACPKTRNIHNKNCNKYMVNCTLCEELLPNNQRLLEHYRRVHPGERKHQCSQCDMQFSARLTLLQHERAKHSTSNAEHTCPECGKRFAWENDLKSHVKYHQSKKPLACAHCEKQTVSKKALSEHVARFHPQAATEKDLRRVVQRDRAMNRLKAMLTKKSVQNSTDGDSVKA